MERFETAFGHWILRHRAWVIIGSLLLVVLAASGGRFLSFTTNYRVFFSHDNPHLLAFEALENRYSKNDNVMFVLKPKEGDIFTRENLAVVEELSAREKAWQIPYSTRVDSITNFQHTYAQGDDLIVEDLVSDARKLSDADIQRIRTVALEEPLLRGRLLAPDGKTTAVNVVVQLPGDDPAAENPAVVEAARAMAEEIRQKYPNMDVRLVGMIMLNHAFTEASMSDMSSLIPIAMGVMVLFLALLLRGYSGTAGTVLVIFMSILTAMGLGGHIGFPLTPPSASAPIIILTVAIANSVHILVTLYHQLRHGKTKNEAIIESLRINLQPVFLTSVTTALGFLSMNFSEVPPFQHLGNLVAFGVLASFILSVGFLPALMSYLPAKSRALKGNDELMGRVADFVIRRRRGLLWGMAAVMLTLIALVPKNELNDVFVHYFDTDIVFRQDVDFTEKNLSGMYIIEYSLDSGESGGLSKPEFLQNVAAFTDWYRSQPETDHVNSITDIMKRLNKNMHGEQEQMYRLPQSRELSAQYLLLYEMSLPYGLDLNNQIDVDKTSTRLLVTTKTVSTKQLLALEKRAQEWLRTQAPHIRPADGSGTTMMFAHIGKRNIVAMLGGTSMALVLISLLLIFAFRSLKIGLISMIPNLMPAAMGFGLWGLLQGQVGLALSVVTGMTLGIVVDDTVHFLSKYLRAQRELGYNSQQAVRYAFTTVGRALVITSLVLVAGFLILSMSSFKLNSDMGLLTAIVIALALAADFLFLPPLLMKMEEKRDEQTASAKLAADTPAGT